MQQITILKVSENMAEATVGTWHVAEGSPVSEGDNVVDLITEKATFEIEAEQDGVLLKQFAQTKSIVPVGFTVAVIGLEDEPVPSEIEKKNEELLNGPGIRISDNQTAPRRKPGGTKIKATPAARRKAKAESIELSEVKRALAIDGVVTEKHVDEYIERSPGDCAE